MGGREHGCTERGHGTYVPAFTSEYHTGSGGVKAGQIGLRGDHVQRRRLLSRPRIRPLVRAAEWVPRARSTGTGFRAGPRKEVLAQLHRAIGEGQHRRRKGNLERVADEERKDAECERPVRPDERSEPRHSDT